MMKTCRLPGVWARLLLALAIAAAVCAAAPVEAPVSGRLSLSAGAALRDSRQDDGALPVRFSGFAPTHLSLSLAYFIGHTPLGFTVDGGGEWFRATGKDLKGNAVQVGESALRLGAAAVGRFKLGRGLTIEAQLGYAFGQLPALDASSGTAVVAAKVSHHGPMIAALFAYDGGGLLAASVRGRAAPFAVDASAPSGKLALGQYGAGAEVAVGRFSLGAFKVSPLVDYELSITQAGRDRFGLTFIAHRFGLGLRAVLPGPELPAEPTPPPSGPGVIRGRVLLSDGKSPGAGATVEVVGGGRLTADADGAFEVPATGPGKVTLRATATGYTAATQELDVPPGGEAVASLVLQRPTGPGSVRGVARITNPKGPAANVPIEVGGRVFRTGADGAFVLTDVGPGPVKVVVKAPGFQPLEELVSVPPGAEATLELALTKLGQKSLATLRGLVRSTRGAPVPALVKVREAAANTRAGADGRFLIRLPGGKYTVVIEAKGYVTQTKSVDVGDGDQAIFHCDLEPGER